MSLFILNTAVLECLNVNIYKMNTEWLLSLNKLMKPISLTGDRRDCLNHLKSPAPTYFMQSFRAFCTYWLLKSDRKLKANIFKVTKFVFSRAGLLEIQSHRITIKHY